MLSDGPHGARRSGHGKNGKDEKNERCEIPREGTQQLISGGTNLGESRSGKTDGRTDVTELNLNLEAVGKQRGPAEEIPEADQGEGVELAVGEVPFGRRSLPTNYREVGAIGVMRGGVACTRQIAWGGCRGEKSADAPEVAAWCGVGSRGSVGWRCQSRSTLPVKDP